MRETKNPGMKVFLLIVIIITDIQCGLSGFFCNGYLPLYITLFSWLFSGLFLWLPVASALNRYNWWKMAILWPFAILSDNVLIWVLGQERIEGGVMNGPIDKDLLPIIYDDLVEDTEDEDNNGL